MKACRLIFMTLLSFGLLRCDAAGQAAPAQPKTPFQLAFGYTVGHYMDDNGLPVGWFGSLAARPLKGLTVVGEVSGDYETRLVALLPVRTETYAFLNGLRVASRPDKKARVFAELLVGVVHNREFRSEESGANRFAAQPGAGFDLALHPRVAVRFHGAARIPSGGTPAKTSFRYVTGVVVSGKSGS